MYKEVMGTYLLKCKYDSHVSYVSHRAGAQRYGHVHPAFLDFTDHVFDKKWEHGLRAIMDFD